MDNKKYYKYFLILICCFTVLRLFLSVYLGLGDDEAYYWEWSRNLALSYFDHPSLVGYIIYFFTALFGKNAFAVRIGSVLLFISTTVLVYKISYEMFKDEKSAFYSALILNITPVFSAGAFMAFPDAPLGFFWVATLYVIYKIISTGDKRLWYLGGVLVGLAMLSKYNAVLIPLSVLIFLLASKEHRSWLQKKEPYLAGALALLVFSPIVIWNINNGWASFGFQFSHGISNEASSFSFKNTGFLIASQMLYISPFLMIFALYSMFWSWKKGMKEGNSNYLLLSCFAVPTMVLFNIAGIFKRTMPHWTTLGFISLFIILPVMFKELGGLDNKKVKINTILTFTFTIIITLIITVQSLYPLIPIKPYDVTHDLYGWPAAAEKAVSVRNDMARESKTDIFWLTHFHLTASQLAFYLPGDGDDTVYNFSRRVSQYNFWFDSSDIRKLKGKNAVYVNTSHYEDKPEDYFIFDSMHMEEPVKILRGGKYARSFDIYRIYNFQGVKQ